MSLSVFLVGLVVVGLLIAAGISLSKLFNKCYNMLVMENMKLNERGEK